MSINLDTANNLVEFARRLRREQNLNPMTICVLDRQGHIVSAQRETGSHLLSFEIAYGKAWTCLGLGISTRSIKDVLSKENPALVTSLAAASNGRWMPAYGGLLLMTPLGELIGAFGVSGNTEIQDENIAIEVLKINGFKLHTNPSN